MTTTTRRTTAARTSTRKHAVTAEPKVLTRAERSAANKAAFAASKATATTAKPKAATTHVANRTPVKPKPERKQVQHETVVITRTRKLTAAERKAKQVERETLAIEVAAKASRLANYQADQLQLPSNERRLDPELKLVLGYASSRRKLETVEAELAGL